MPLAADRASRLARALDAEVTLVSVVYAPDIALRADRGDSAAVAAKERIVAADPLHAHAEPAGLDHAVLEAAVSLREGLDAKLYVAHAYPAPEQFALASSVEVLPGVFYGVENIETVHRRAAEELVTSCGIGPDSLDMRPGDPRNVIADVAREREAGLVVIGALKRSRLEQAVLGSTAEAVAADVECDVLLVKTPAAAA